MTAPYSRVERGVWDSADFRALSASHPNAQSLWLYLLSCPEHVAFPGLFVLTAGAAAERLLWLPADVLAKLEEIVAAGMARFDPRSRLVWLPKALVRRRDEAKSSKTTKGWRNAWDGMPNCALRTEAFDAAVSTIRLVGDAAALAAFGAEAPPEALRCPFDAPSMPLPAFEKSTEAPPMPLPAFEKSTEAPPMQDLDQIRIRSGKDEEQSARGAPEAPPLGEALRAGETAEAKRRAELEAAAVTEPKIVSPAARKPTLCDPFTPESDAAIVAGICPQKAEIVAQMLVDIRGVTPFCPSASVETAVRVTKMILDAFDASPEMRKTSPNREDLGDLVDATVARIPEERAKAPAMGDETLLAKLPRVFGWEMRNRVDQLRRDVRSRPRGAA